MRRKISLWFSVAAILAFFTACNQNVEEKFLKDTTPPGKVTNVTATKGNGNVLLSWSNPTDKDFYGVEISANPAAGSLEKSVVVKNVASYLVTGLTNGTAYTFSLKAMDDSTNLSAAETTEATPEAQAVDPVVIPNATNFKVDSTASKKVTLSWTKPDGDFYCYNLLVTKGSKTDSYVLDKALKTYTVSGLTNDQEYTFVLKVVDASLNLSSGVEVKGTPAKPIDYIAPLISSSRSESLDYIFNPDVLGETTVTISRAEWNKMLGYYDQNFKNETNVKAAKYTFKKGDKEWNIPDVGFRIRGNTSRTRPQKQDGSYVQAHFKVGFEEFLGEDEEAKLSKCMKGVILKRFNNDSNYVREIFGYNLFREKGVWTAPRAAYTRLFIKIIEDDETEKLLNYGVYIMLEATDKQYVKARAEANEAGNYTSDTGNLWKCTWQGGNGPNLSSSYEFSDFGVEHVELDDTYSARYNYDLKTNKENLPQAAADFKKWIKKLNNCSTVEQIQAWYEANMDVDLFLKTYAINVALGMDDDYWRNKNNYYMYFDSSKAYFIPYDYDNILGTNCFSDTATRDPLNWGEGVFDAPLIEKALKVDAYKEKYKQYLAEYAKDEYVTASINKITAWNDLIRSYTNSPDLTYSSGTTSTIEDHPATWCTNYNSGTPYKLLTGDENNNFFKAKAATINRDLNATNISVTYNLNSGSVYVSEEGLKTSVTLTVLSSKNLKNAFESWLYDTSVSKTLSYVDHKHSIKSWRNSEGVDTVYSDAHITLTANWVLDDTTYVPYTYDASEKKVTFIFNPALYDMYSSHLTKDFNTYNGTIPHSNAEIEAVYIAHSDNNNSDNWAQIAKSSSLNYKCLRDGDSFKLTTSITSWSGQEFQFIVVYSINGEKYFQWNSWKQMLSPAKESFTYNYLQKESDKNFLINQDDFASAKSS